MTTTNQTAPVYADAADNFQDITPEVIAYMATRGISEQTLRRNRVGFAPRTRIGPCVAFRTYFAGKLYRAKMRTLEGKNFTQIPNCPPMPYKADDVVNGRYALITEGEIDALSWEEAGVPEAISLDSGAANPGTEVGGKLKCLDAVRPYLDGKEGIYIAMDSDEPGQYTALKIAEKLGVYRCYRVVYPEGCKDANDVLLTYGPAALRDCVKNARRFTLADIGAQNEVIRSVLETRFDYNDRVEEEPAILKAYAAGREYPLGSFGQIGIVTGHEKSGKSYVMSCLAAAGLARESRLGFTLDLQGRRMLWFDTEQSYFFYHLSQRRIHELGRCYGNAHEYEAYHLRRHTPHERREAIEYIIRNTPDVGVVVIDGVVDLMDDYNDLKETQELVGELMRITDEYDILLLTVLHVNKGDGKVRGHIGSELKNKCDFMLKVTSSGSGEFSISNPTCRYMTFPEFSFSRTEEGGYILSDTPF